MGVLAEVHLAHKRYLQEPLLRAGLTIKQMTLLGALSRRKFLCPSEIADIFFSDRPTVSGMLRGMEKKGWLARERDPDNARRVRVVLLPAGRAKLEEVRAVPEVRRCRRLDPLACLDAAEKDTLTGLLARVKTHLNESTQG
jgi:DNA-binding MarR family transcriptional regulator